MRAVFTLMQRCIFFIVFALSLHFVKAQTIDVLSYQVDVNILDVEVQTINAQVEIELLATGADSVKLHCGKHLQINSVAWREGRIKGYLSFRQAEDAIYIALPQNRNTAKTVLKIEYALNLAEAEVQPYITQNASLLAINPSSMFKGVSLGYAGLLFPAIADDPALIHTNFGHSAKYTTGTVGTVNFYTTEKDKVVATFWNSEKPLNPANYFIAVGLFTEFEPKELDEVYSFTEASNERILAEQTERNLGSAKGFIEARFDRTFTDKDLTSIDSLSKLPLPDFLITPTNFDTKAYKIQQAAFLWSTNFTINTANEIFTEYFKNEKGTEAFERLLNEKWQTSKKPSFALLSEYKKQYLKVNSLFEDSVKQRFVTSVDTGSLPVIDVQYQYTGGTQQQLIYITQDTAVTNTFSFPVSIRLAAKDTLLPIQKALVLAKPMDTLSFDMNNAPQSVSVNVGAFFPGYVYDAKPDYYALFDLSNAKSYAQRAQALEQLFTTKNANLYSTVVGIALRDEDPAIRQKALNAAEKVNTVGAFKIKDTLVQFKTSEPEPNLRKQAAALYLKLYGEE